MDLIPTLQRPVTIKSLADRVESGTADSNRLPIQMGGKKVAGNKITYIMQGIANECIHDKD